MPRGHHVRKRVRTTGRECCAREPVFADVISTTLAHLESPARSHASQPIRLIANHATERIRSGP